MLSAVSRAPEARPPHAALLDDPSLHAELRRFIATRVPEPEVDDVLQTSLTAALESSAAPAEPEALRRWLFGLTRHKVADHFRRSGREPLLSDEAPEQAAPDSARREAEELLRWAEHELPPGESSQDTLEWMLREGDGEPLESIAREQNLPAPRVRQRVSRLRRYLRSRWAATAAVAGVLLVAAVWLSQSNERPITAPLPSGPWVTAEPPDARSLRSEAARACQAEQWRRCLVLYDEAKAADAAGDAEPEVQAARARAHAAIANQGPVDAPNQATSPDAAPPDAAAPDAASPDAAPPNSLKTPTPKAPPNRLKRPVTAPKEPPQQELEPQPQQRK